VPYSLTEQTQWRWLNPTPGSSSVAFEGRLLGGCLDTLLHLAAGPWAPWPGPGTVLFLENAEQSPPALVRALHRLRSAGWLDGLNGLLWGRSTATDGKEGVSALRFEHVLERELATLPCPVLVDVDIGHRPPQMLLINGARAQVRWSEAAGGEVVQTLA
jgi:muramoyltetrapeptide carboxypeptidase